jgi:flagellar biosynthesis/type III secretory pathway M-ring protein FliF/YscJ
MMTPEIREKKRLELELAREKKRLEEEEKRRLAEEERRHAEEERKRKAEQDQRDYEELVTYAKDFVAKDPRVVANVFKTWMNADAKPM